MSLTESVEIPAAIEELANRNVLSYDMTVDDYAPYSGDQDRFDWSLIKV